jgi:hypothetical protein
MKKIGICTMCRWHTVFLESSDFMYAITFDGKINGNCVTGKKSLFPSLSTSIFFPGCNNPITVGDIAPDASWAENRVSTADKTPFAVSCFGRPKTKCITFILHLKNLEILQTYEA